MPATDPEPIVSIPQSRLRIAIDPSGFRFGAESLRLVDFIPDRKYRRAADLGSGDGVIALLLAERCRVEEVWAVELDPDCCRRAGENTALNRLAGIVQIRQADIRRISGVFQKGSMDLVTANPPFFGPGRDHRNLGSREMAARQEYTGTLRNFLYAARFLLKRGAPLVLLYHPSRLDYLFQELARANLTAKQMKLLYHSDGRALFVLLLAVPGGAPGLVVHTPEILPDSFKIQNRDME